MKTLLAILFLCCNCYCNYAQDNRCFLIGGGSTEIFLVNENAPIGSVIGVLRIEGDPSQNGDVVLRLKTNSSVISIQEHSKKLILVAPLDKEAIDGPAHVTNSVICERKGSSAEPALTIPVTIRVQDANDNSPQFQNASYSVTVSESTHVGSVILQGIKATDADQPGPFSMVQFSVLAGPFSHLLDFANSMEGSLILRKALDYEETKQFNVTIRASDQGSPALYNDTVVSVRVLDSDDQNPVFSWPKYVAYIPQPAVQASLLQVMPDNLHAFDQDLGINSSIRYVWSGVGAEYVGFSLDPVNGTVALTRQLQDNEFIQPVTLIAKALQLDNKDRYALTTLTISRQSSFSPPLQFVQRTYDVAVLESVPLNSTLLFVAVNKPGDKNVRFIVDAQVEGLFRVDPSGQVRLVDTLDYEKNTRHQFVVWATDGATNDTALVNVTVLNVNDWDPQFQQAVYEFSINESQLPIGFIVGKIDVSDADFNDRVDLQLRGSDSKAFSINEVGEIMLQDPLLLNGTSVELTILARDSGIPPRQTSAVVRIHFPADFLLNRGSDNWVTTGSSSLIMILLGILLGILCLVISGLAIYVCQSQKKKSDNAILPQVNPIYQPQDRPMTATLRRMPINPLARNCGGGGGRAIAIQSPTSPPLLLPSNRVSPLSGSPNRAFEPNGTNNSDQQSNRSSASPMRQVDKSVLPPEMLAWPNDSIPKRVKKLSWEDEYNVFF